MSKFPSSLLVQIKLINVNKIEPCYKVLPRCLMSGRNTLTGRKLNFIRQRVQNVWTYIQQPTMCVFFLLLSV